MVGMDQAVKTPSGRSTVARINAFLSSDAFKIFVGLFILYMLTMKTLRVSDTQPLDMMPVMIIKRFSLNFDVFKDPHNYLFYPHNGHIYSVFPPGTSIATLPVYLIPVLLMSKITLPWVAFLGKVSAALFASLSAVFIYLTVRELSNRKNAVVVALVFGVATNLFSMASQMLLNFTGAILFITMGLYCLASAKRSGNRVLAAGFAFSFAGLCQPLCFLFLVVFGVYVLRKRYSVLRYAAGALPPALIFFYVNWLSFGSPLRTGEILSATFLQTRTWNPANIKYPLWSTPLVKGLGGVLISPSRGIFAWSPVLLFALLGLVMFVRMKRDTLYGYAAFCALLPILVSARWIWWDGGNSWGYRITLASLPFIVLLLAPALSTVWRRKWLLVVFSVLLAFSLFVQVVGYLAYDGASWEWQVKPVSKYWSIKDGQLIWQLRNFTFYIPSFWQDAISSPIKVAVRGHTLIKTGDRYWLEVEVDATQVGTIDLLLSRDDRVLASRAQRIPRGVSTVRLRPPFTKNGHMSTLRIMFSDEMGVERTIESRLVNYSPGI